MSESGPTLRAILLASQGQQTKFDTLKLLPGFDIGDSMRALLATQAKTSGFAQLAAQALTIQARAGTGASVAVKFAAAAAAAQQKPILTTYAKILADSHFRSTQRLMVTELLKQSSAAQVAAAASVAADALPQPPGSESGSADPADKAYGSHQLTRAQTLQMAAVLWPIVQVTLQSATSKHLIESYLVTLFLVVLIWCTLAAAP